MPRALPSGSAGAIAELYRLKGELLLRIEDWGLLSPRHRENPTARGEITGIARRDEPGPTAPAPRQASRSATIDLAGLRVFHRRLRHGGFKGRQGATWWTVIRISNPARTAAGATHRRSLGRRDCNWHSPS